MKVSVALAYYNGGKYICEQLDSILKQLDSEDEVIISVDGASDGSEHLLQTYVQQDSRIHVIEGPKKGVVYNFANAISTCKGDIIFLSDQDDIWVDGKVQKIRKAFERTKVDAILHNASLVDGEGRKISEETLFDLRKSRTGLIKNLVKNSYVGCCMAFRKELIPIILPIPEAMYMHDYWIGMAAEKQNGVGLIKEPLILYRRHGDNVTELQHGSIRFMIKKRIDIIRCLFLLKKRIKQRS